MSVVEATASWVVCNPDQFLLFREDLVREEVLERWDGIQQSIVSGYSSLDFCLECSLFANGIIKWPLV